MPNSSSTVSISLFLKHHDKVRLLGLTAKIVEIMQLDFALNQGRKRTFFK